MDIFELFSKQYCHHRGYTGHALPNGILLGEDVEEGTEGYVGHGCSYKNLHPSKNWDDWQKCCEENCPFMKALMEHNAGRQQVTGNLVDAVNTLDSAT